MSSPLRLATAGSVDDGESSLVGRLLSDTKSVLADAADQLEPNRIGAVRLRVAEPLPTDEYGTSPRTGPFVVIEPASGDTLAAAGIGDRLGVLSGAGNRP